MSKYVRRHLLAFETCAGIRGFADMLAEDVLEAGTSNCGITGIDEEFVYAGQISSHSKPGTQVSRGTFPERQRSLSTPLTNHPNAGAWMQRERTLR
jgi:hypothetical protein